MTIESIKQWFEVVAPEPTDKNRSVQLGVHFEEIGEQFTAVSQHDFAEAIAGLANVLKKELPGLEIDNPGINRLELLDGLCDTIVTAAGVCHMFKMDLLGALAEVNRSNFSKFVDGKPVFDENGKIMKPESFSPPDLTPFVGPL